jgi:hypothetical protein
MDDYIFENGSKMTNLQPDDPNYTFENGTKPKWPKVVAKPKSIADEKTLHFRRGAECVWKCFYALRLV